VLLDCTPLPRDARLVVLRSNTIRISRGAHGQGRHRLHAVLGRSRPDRVTIHRETTTSTSDRVCRVSANPRKSVLESQRQNSEDCFFDGPRFPAEVSTAPTRRLVGNTARNTTILAVVSHRRELPRADARSGPDVLEIASDPVKDHLVPALAVERLQHEVSLVGKYQGLGRHAVPT
jgi:hypothetical protein